MRRTPVLSLIASVALAVALASLVACGGGSSDPTDAAGPGAPDGAGPGAPDAGGGTTDAGPWVDRPYNFLVPASYDPATPTPLVILLHGYSATAFIQNAYFGFSALAESAGFLYAYPDGTTDTSGKQFWNATDFCCDFGATGVDDVAYLTWIIDDVSANYNVDPKRIFFVGHSNGGFMSYRMACELSSRVAAIVSLAGAMWLDPAQCQPTDPVAVLQVHGDLDDTIAYAGAAGYPSAAASVGFWVAHDGCGDTPETDAPLDIDTGLAGAETAVQRWTGCDAGGAAELWTIQGGSHIPGLDADWGTLVWGFLSAHPKP